jgi:predicted dinucleotide-binding enzyme
MAEDRFIARGRRDFFRVAAGSGAVMALAAAPWAALAQQAPAQPLKIGTVGAGRIGGTLGTLWVRAGHQVMFSSRNPEQLKDLVAGLGPRARAGTPAEAIAFADVVLLAVPYKAMPQIAKDFGRDLAAKALVLDATNPFVSRDGEIAAWAREKGAGAASAELLPGVRLVRAFNAIGAARLPEAGKRPPGERIGMPMAGDDAQALALASRLVREIGFEPVVIGPLVMGNHLLPGTPLAGEQTPEQLRRALATLK